MATTNLFVLEMGNALIFYSNKTLVKSRQSLLSALKLIELEIKQQEDEDLKTCEL